MPHKEDSFLIPSWRIPLLQYAHDAGDDDDEHEIGGGAGEAEWQRQGIQLWDATCEVMSSAAVLETSSGFQQLDECRANVAQQLTSLRPTVSLLSSSSLTVTPEQLQEQFQQPQQALEEYSNVLQMCRQEMEVVLQNNDGNNNISEEDAPSGTVSPSAEGFSVLLREEQERQEPLFLALKWKADNNSTSEPLLRPPCPPPPDPQSSNNQVLVASALWTWILTWELSNVYYNMAVLELQLALVLNRQDTRDSVKKAGTHWQTAASLFRYLRAQLTLSPSAAAAIPAQPASAPPPPTLDLTPLWQPQRILAWESWMIAEAQRAAYQYMAKAPRPSPLMLAKLAAGAVPLYAQAAEATTLLNKNNNNNEVLSVANSDVWKCWHMCFHAISEFHQGAVHASRKQWAPAMARLQHKAMPLGRHGQEFFHSLMAEYGATFEVESYAATPPWFLKDLHGWIQTAWPEMRELNSTVQSNMDAKTVVPDESSLKDIPPQSLVKVTTPTLIVDFSKTDNEKKLFPQLNTLACTYRSQFQKDLQHLAEQTAEAADAKTEAARQALAEVDLPLALERFQQEREEGAQRDNLKRPPSSESSREEQHGPSDWMALRDRLEGIQKGNGSGHNAGLSELQQGLWELRDNAERAHGLVDQIKQQLEENVRMEQEFSDTHPNYQGQHHTTSSTEPPKSPAARVKEIQSPCVVSLEKYGQLLQAADQGDQVLFGRLESLPTDPKFQLLAKLNEAQLERLLSAVERSRQENPTELGSRQESVSSSSSRPTQELLSAVENLNRYLLELSMLFEARDDLVHERLPEEIKISLQHATNELMRSGIVAGAEMDENNQNNSKEKAVCEEIIQRVQPAVQSVLDEIRSNLNQQGKLLKKIMKENEVFEHHLEQYHQANGGGNGDGRARKVSGASSVAKSTSPAEKTLLHLQEALDEMDEMTNHWKQGAEFYDSVVTKLLKLQQQVSDISTQLAIERCEYEEDVARSNQEAKDASLAKELAKEHENDSVNSSDDDDDDDGDDVDDDDDDDDDASANDHKRSAKDHRRAQLEQEAELISRTSLSSNGIHSRQSLGMPSPQRSRVTSDDEDDDDENDDSSSSSSSSGSSDDPEKEEEKEKQDTSRFSLRPCQPQNDNSSFRIDDQAMANLVAMEFDPERVVAALEKYNNDVEEALNDLLSG